MDCPNAMGWPDVLVLAVFFAFLAFIAWLAMRD